jgi:hypothetical protein
VNGDGITKIIDQEKADALSKGRERIAEIETGRTRGGRSDAGGNVKAARFPVRRQAHPFARCDAFAPIRDQAIEPWIERCWIFYSDFARTKPRNFPSHLNQRQEPRSPEAL